MLIDRLHQVLAPDYTVDRPLGSGGMGEVFLGQDVALKRPVAIKVLRPQFDTADLSARFVREAQTIANLSHPNIVPIFVSNRKDGLSYYVMQYVSDGTLADRLRQGPIAEREARAIGRDLLAGLAAAHQARVVHRDVKPSNVFLARTGAMLGDFGIAHTPSEDSAGNLTTPGQAIGTPAYMSPEQSMGLSVDSRSDIYSVGLVLYEMVTGTRWRAKLRHPKQADWTGISRRLARVILRALALSPEGRWQTADSFRAALAALEEPRFARYAGTLISCTVVGVGVWLVIHPHRPVCPPHSATDVAFLPFSVSGDSAVVDGSNFSQLVKTELDWFGRIRMTSDRAVACWIGSVPPEKREAIAVEGLNARQVVSGLLLPQASGWMLRLTVRDSEPEPAFVFTIPGNPNDVFSWSRAAADSVVHRVFPGNWEYYSDLRKRANPNSNRQAYAKFFEGERDFQRDAFNNARQAYEAALARDSTFLFAAWRLGIVYRFLRVPFEDHLRHLYERRGELPEQYRRLIAALLDPDLRRRFEHYRATVQEFPRDGYVRFVYADELFHRGPLVGYPLDSALAQFRAAAAIDRDVEQMPVYDHLLYGYILLGRRAEADSALRDRMDLPPSNEEQEEQRRAFLRFAYDARFRPWLASLKARWFGFVVDSSTLASANQFARLGTSFDIPATQVALGRILVARGTRPEMIANGHRAQGLGLMLQGQPVSALAELDSAALTAGQEDSLVERAEWRVIPSALGLPGIPDAEREWGLARLHELEGSGRVGARATWALAVAAYSQDDSSVGRELATHLARPETRNLRRLLDALYAGAAGKYAEALQHTDSLIGYEAADLVSDPFARSVLYLARSRWQAALGDRSGSEATRLWYLNSDSGIDGWPQHALEAGEVDVLLSAVLRLANAEEKRLRGDRAGACGLALRVRELWRNAEPSFGPLRARADSAARGCPR